MLHNVALRVPNNNDRGLTVPEAPNERQGLKVLQNINTLMRDTQTVQLPVCRSALRAIRLRVNRNTQLLLTFQSNQSRPYHVLSWTRLAHRTN